jgi:UPF0042 nucleotide-binding protein
MSGSGKSTVLNVLEDQGFYCVDNLPVALLGSFVAEMAERDDAVRKGAAVGIDARSSIDELRRFAEYREAARIPGVACELLFLDADDDVLLKRFSETRRKHPLSDDATSLAEAIQRERELLEPFSASADLRLDTTRTNLHQLRDQVTQSLVGGDEAGMAVLFESFGFKHGHPNDADFVFDLRCLPNPHWVADLRALTGRDQGVIEFLQGKEDVESMFADISHFLSQWIPRFEAENRSYLTVAVGCTGGQHRSVYMAERLQRYFSKVFQRVQVRHRELG